MESVRAYSHYLATKGQLIGLTTVDGHKPTALEKEVQGEIRRACDNMVKTLSYCTPDEIANLTGYYTVLYTIGYHKLPETSLVEAQRDRLLRHWNSGDKSIEESDVYGMLLDSMCTPMNARPSAPLQALHKLRKSWIAVLSKFNTFPNTNTHERYRRLALIMRDNIDSCFDGDSTRAKESWFEKNRLSDISAVGTKILTAYRQFVCSLFPAVLTSGEMTELDIAVLEELISRKDLYDYDRKAYQLALEAEMKQNA